MSAHPTHSDASNVDTLITSHAHVWDVGRSRRTQRKPTEAQGEHANSTQWPKPETIFFSLLINVITK